MDEELAECRGCLKHHREMLPLREFSARIGADPLLVQASTGNASVKIDGDLWIKASGKWLADAQRRQIFVAAPLERILDVLARGEDMGGLSCAVPGGRLQPSIETPMHAVLSHRVVIHVHSISTIAWAVQQDGQARVSELLRGLRWSWIPYVDSGVALALAIQSAIAHSPESDVFVLANHGLVVCAPDCDRASRLLEEVEKRVAAAPRRFPDPDLGTLRVIARSGDWQLPEDHTLHALGADPISRRILSDGFLYPCHAMFFRCSRFRPFRIVEDCGILLTRGISKVDLAMLTGLAHVILRVAADARVRYLSPCELHRVSVASSAQYRGLAEQAAAS